VAEDKEFPMTRIGAIIKFKPGTTDVEAARALKSIAGILDLPEKSGQLVPMLPVEIEEADMSKRGVLILKGERVKIVDVPFDPIDLIQSWDDDHGRGPVWYIP
jgi:hypothetical protein